MWILALDVIHFLENLVRIVVREGVESEFFRTWPGPY